MKKLKKTILDLLDQHMAGKAAEGEGGWVLQADHQAPCKPSVCVEQVTASSPVDTRPGCRPLALGEGNRGTRLKALTYMQREEKRQLFQTGLLYFHIQPAERTCHTCTAGVHGHGASELGGTQAVCCPPASLQDAPNTGPHREQ